MARNKSYFSGVPRNNKKDPTQDALTENIEVLTGQRGDKQNRALLFRDLVNLDELTRQSLISSIKQNNTGGLPVIVGGGIERPHAPVNLSGTGGFTFIALMWDKPSYKGHVYAEIFRSDTDDYSAAIKIATVVSDIFSDSVSMGTGYYYWVRFVNKADMKGPTQGASGLYVETVESAEAILDKLGNQIETSHLGEFLTSEIGKITDIEGNVDQFLVDIPPLLIDVPSIKSAVFDEDGIVEITKQEVQDAKETAETVMLNNESLALNLIDAALLSDLNWENNTLSLVSLESSIDDVSARIDSEFLTITQANLAIAAAAETIRVEIEENGTSLTGDIASTYYTKATTDEAIALANTALKALIEDPSGSSIGATLNDSYYTSTSTDEAIAAAGVTLQSILEDPNGSSIGSTLFTDYYTKITTDEAIAQSNLALKTAIEDVNGSSLGATLYDGYYTKATTDEAIATANTLLKSAIEDPNGDSIGATLFNSYETKANSEQSLAQSIFELDSTFNDSLNTFLDNALGNDLEADRQRIITANFTQSQKALADETQALSESVEIFKAQFNDSEANIVDVTRAFADNITATAEKFTLLTSSISNVSADIYQNFYTKASADSAISEANTALKTLIEDPSGSSVGADLQTNYRTTADTNIAIGEAITLLKTAIEATDGSSVGADLYNNHYTKATADEAIAEAITALKSAIEDPNGTSVSAELSTNHYTKTTADEAISAAVTALKSAIENTSGSSVGATLSTNYRTETATDTAISTAISTLRTAIENPNGSSIGADLQTNYRTATNTDIAIATAITTLQTFIENPSGSSIGAALVTDYRTKTDTDTAISTANTTLQALIEDANGSSVGASLQTLSETVANNTGDFSAMWGVKTQVADITASFGLLNDGDDPIFAIKGAKFAIITDQDPTVVTPVFAVVDGKTVMKSALIDEAHIQSLVTDDLLSNRIVVGSELNTPSINYNKTTGARSQNFSMDPNGNIVAKSAVLESVTIKDADGNVVMSSTGAVPYSKLIGAPTLGSLASQNSLNYNSLTSKPALGSLAALDSITYNSLTEKPTLGPFSGLTKILSTNITTYIESGAIGSAQIDQAWIAELFGDNATFSGEVYANKITGDLVDADIVSVSAAFDDISSFFWTTIKTISVERNANYDVWLTIDDLIPAMDTTSGFGELYTRLKYSSQTSKAVSIPSGTSVVSVEIQVKTIEMLNSETPVSTSVPTQNAILQMFRKGSGFIV